jgi:alanyl-tRNA synthetase
MKSVEIRKAFLDFFEQKKHHLVPSAPMVVKNDPTLMFTNAGMNQFKDVFLGNSPATYARIADTQKCLRVSGKHNDLEEVGHDTYHHTMFEMLGNWSFGGNQGAYFKKEAIDWAWELLTEVLKIDKNNLYITVFEGDKGDGLDMDQEAFDFWARMVPTDHILMGSKKDNFWEMGDTGPCGPCSEIHVDIRTEDEKKKISGKELVNHDHPEVIEIWNLVFIEFNRLSSGKLEPLAAKHVDTGMGFERLSMVIQGVRSNYDTDVFTPLIAEVAKMAGISYRYDKDKDVAMRVISDHIRAVSFAIADGQLPSNTGAGYVIRRILRRAVRYGFTFLGFEEPFMFQLVDVLADQMGTYFPELPSQKEFIIQVIKEEEQAFLRTLAHGIRKFDQYLVQVGNSKTIDGAFAFELFDTFGFPIDLTQLIAREKGYTVDMVGFASGLEEQKNRSRSAATVETGDWIEMPGTTVSDGFVGYNCLEADVRIIKYRKVVAKKKTNFEVVLNRTPFYAESGGQVGDVGVLISETESIRVVDTKKENNLTVHYLNNLPKNPEADFKAVVDAETRQLTANNHSATHLMHAALRQVLGLHVEQKGSMVDAERFRFDFAYFSKMTNEEILQVEQIVNRKIRENVPGDIQQDVPISQALEMGAMALFGEKYGDTVRVVTFDPKYSVELCGGTHTSATGNIGFFKIVSESGIAAGVRRIEAVTGPQAEKYVNDQLETLHLIGNQFKNQPNTVLAVMQTLEKNTSLQREIDTLQKEKAGQLAGNLFAGGVEIGASRFIAGKLQMDVNQAKLLAQKLRTMATNVVVVLAALQDDKINLVIAASDELVKDANFNAGTVIKQVATFIKGGGGGQPHMATAGGKEINGFEAVISEVKKLLV